MLDLIRYKSDCFFKISTNIRYRDYRIRIDNRSDMDIPGIILICNSPTYHVLHYVVQEYFVLKNNTLISQSRDSCRFCSRKKQAKHQQQRYTYTHTRYVVWCARRFFRPIDIYAIHSVIVLVDVMHKAVPVHVPISHNDKLRGHKLRGTENTSNVARTGYEKQNINETKQATKQTQFNLNCEPGPFAGRTRTRLAGLFFFVELPWSYCFMYSL